MSPDDDLFHDRLHDLFDDAVRDVTPADRLGEIRRRTTYRPGRNRRRRALAVLGAGTATAAVVAVTALVGALRHDDAPPAADQAKPSPAAVYFVGETPIGPRLFREFQPIPAAADPADRALDALRRMEVDAGPDDPDYTTSWPAGSFRSVSVDDTGITIELAVTAVPAPSAPAGAVSLSVQQAVHTADAAVGSPLPVAFQQDGVPVSEVLGVAVEPTTTRLTRVEAPVNISDPAEGLVTGARWLSVRGQVTPVAAERPAKVAYELSDATGTVGAGTVPVEGLSWSMTIDLNGYAPGRYTLSAWSADSARIARARDTRTFIVR